VTLPGDAHRGRQPAYAASCDEYLRHLVSRSLVVADRSVVPALLRAAGGGFESGKGAPRDPGTPAVIPLPSGKAGAGRNERGHSLNSPEVP
jgi:hypothetical protein